MNGRRDAPPCRATYRFQLTAECGLEHVRTLLDHVAALGVSHLYLSPVLEARSGSEHGYDGTDPTRVRAALGGDEAFARLVRDARDRGLGILLDIVPNHMAASEENPWFRDLLEFGHDSPFAGHFDLSWRASPRHRRIALPILGQDVAAAIDAGEIELTADEQGIGVRYFERRLPLDPRTYELVLGGLLEAERLDAAPATTDAARTLRAAVTARLRGDAGFRARVHGRLRQIMDAPTEERRGILCALLDRQQYELVFWRHIDRRLSYRRFFDITDLIGVRVGDPQVFADTHVRILEWVAAGAVHGLRIDHIDGLREPAAYLERLRAACDERAPTPGLPILVEKILAHDERLPAEWAADGTTGYEFLNALNGLFIDAAGLERITAGYRQRTGLHATFEDIVYEKKKLVLDELFGGEWRVLTRELATLTEPWRADGDAPAGDAPSGQALAAALLEVTACLHVYRTYIQAVDVVSSRDRARIDAAVAAARERAPDIAAATFERLRALLQLDAARIAPIEPVSALHFVLRWQQLSGPAMAKGLEDTALYTFYPLASANDVGGEPDRAVVTPAGLHAVLRTRLATPRTLNATSTHDTKRSEDVRARINVLSELAEDWLACVARWSTLNDRHHGGHAPTPNEEYLLYQTIVGAWPIDELARADFSGRMQRYMDKALREAKAATSWLEPDQQHERAVARFIERILDAPGNAGFVADLDAFVARIAPYGVLNSLAQVLIKACAPGVPDFYQGTEGWAFDLVDPDNRRPVDFGARRAALETALGLLDRPDARSVAALLRDWTDGRIKVLVTAAALRERAAAAGLFRDGDQLALEPGGCCARHVFGCARVAPAARVDRERDWRVLVVPRLPVALGTATPVGPAVWRDTAVRLPAAAPRAWVNVLNGERVTTRAGTLPIAELFATLPLALLRPAR